jgi:hypothetical protein
MCSFNFQTNPQLPGSALSSFIFLTEKLKQKRTSLSFYLKFYTLNCNNMYISGLHPVIKEVKYPFYL